MSDATHTSPATESSDSDPLVGRVLADRYRVLRVLGEGGMGRVYLAEQKMGTASRQVAIKTLHPDLTKDPELTARFYRESETVIALKHPNTIHFYDFGELEDHTLYIVMEYIDGTPLADVLEQGPMALERIDRLLIQITGSLQEAHQLGIIHRDLKPDNILLSERAGHQDFAKVLDFGIAKKSGPDDMQTSKLTQKGTVLGTPPYMSPEQFSGLELDPGSDIYSLGVMVYEMLTGRLPFEANTPWEWATRHLTADPDPLPESVPATKAQSVMRALAKERTDRPESVVDFMREFTGHEDPQQAWTWTTTPNTETNDTNTGTPGASNPSWTGIQDAASPASHTTSVRLPGLRSGSGKRTRALALFVTLGALLGATAWYLSKDGGQTHQEHSTPLHTTGALPVSDPATPKANAEKTAPSTPVPPSTAPVMPEIENEGEGQAVSGADAPTPVRTTRTRRTPRPTPKRPSQATDNTRTQDPPPQTTTADPMERWVTAANRALQLNNFEAAAQALASAGPTGRSHPGITTARNQLAKKGAQRVGGLMLRGDCPGAQALYRTLALANAAALARSHFTGDWCPRP